MRDPAEFAEYSGETNHDEPRIVMKQHELSKDDFDVIDAALKMYARSLHDTFREKFMTGAITPEGTVCAKAIQTADDLIDKFDRASNAHLEIEEED